jgi:GT2 family glycosyltransferase/glycosyltransferase involved in cell wall biosynthesis
MWGNVAVREGVLVSDSWLWELRDPGFAPEVSIVVCAHGKSDVTMACLQALVQTQHMNVARFEVVLVDDASADDTLARVRPVGGLRLVELTDNVGFLRAANAGLEAARGEHILFLNNDTEPVGRWLDPLVEVLRRNPRALVVGSRLIYPDGMLQEAGGIVFSDASGWNYGRGLDPFDPRVSFPRRVDYVSGASLLVRGDFLRCRGGFDERYAPAYYEDTDLCFAAREAGGEVWYEPASIIVHHEGVSHGTDVSSGLKAYQEVNREKFHDRWEEVLAHQWAPDAAHVSSARQRVDKGRILVIDHEVAAPDRDSGSVRIAAVMKSMLDLGYAVTFMPHNGWRREPYTTQLERMGIEVLGSSTDWWSHVVEMATGISHVWLSRPSVARAFIGHVRASLPDATVIFDTVDLHFLRVQREAETTSDSTRRRHALRQEIEELELIDMADITIVVSDVERDLLLSRTERPVLVVPNVHVDHPEAPGPRDRSGILFVGGFRHTPNVDAMAWFVREILPRIADEEPGVSLTIAGSHPPDEVLALAGDRVTVTGWVDDLVPLYAAARVAVAPLRYGAGVKGKVGEAMSLGVPMVLTSIASEGMHIEHGAQALVADNPEDFAANVVQLLRDDDLWLRFSAAGRQLIHDCFGVDATRVMVEQALSQGARSKEVSWA